MKVAVVHYHLRRGGVTRVVQHATASLRAMGVDVGVLSGEVTGELFPEYVQLGVVEGLGYSDEGDAVRLLSRLEEAACEALGGPPDVWHVHNHCLGKNPALTAAVSKLAGRGERLLLQVHDFPEDWRPDNYCKLKESIVEGVSLYPLGPHIHYAVLNGRDYHFLLSAGIPQRQLHLLANPVAMCADAGADSGGSGAGRSLILYPTRAIRRKNIGEFLLWSATARDDELYAVTLAPENPLSRPVYERWVAFAQDLNLPVEFEYGRRCSLPFDELLGQARWIGTTSVAEGFGLAFLEPWLLKRSLCGRNLSDITDDFSESGVDLSDLYERLDVPLEWVGDDYFRGRLSEAMVAGYAAYGRDCTQADESRAFGAAVAGSLIDVGRLDELMQEQVIRRLCGCSEWKQRVRGVIFPEETPGLTDCNLAAVTANYSLEAYGKRLAGLYRTVADSDWGPVEVLSPDKVLDQFLAPERFCLLRGVGCEKSG